MNSVSSYYIKQSAIWAKLAYDIACRDGGLEAYSHAMNRARYFEKMAKRTDKWDLEEVSK